LGAGPGAQLLGSFVDFVGAPVAEKIPSRRVVVYPQKAPSGMTARGLLAWKRSIVDLTTVSSSSASPLTHSKFLDFFHATLTFSPAITPKHMHSVDITPCTHMEYTAHW